jgi:predicted TIM-barrel enzyme
VAAYLEIVDGVIVGSDLKKDGYTWNPVDPDRVKHFLKAAGR